MTATRRILIVTETTTFGPYARVCGGQPDRAAELTLALLRRSTIPFWFVDLDVPNVSHDGRCPACRELVACTAPACLETHGHASTVPCRRCNLAAVAASES